MFDKINTKMGIKYGLIGMIIIYYISRHNITLGIIFGSAVALIIYYFYNQNYSSRSKQNVDNKQTVKKTVKPKLEFTEKNEEITNYIFSIQDLYHFNPRTFSDIVETLNDFFAIIEKIEMVGMTGEDYETLVMKKRDALNELVFLNTSLPHDPKYTTKIKMAQDKLEDILNKHLDTVYKMYQEDIYNNGYKNTTKNIYIGPLPSNTYDNILDPSVKYDNELY